MIVKADLELVPCLAYLARHEPHLSDDYGGYDLRTRQGVVAADWDVALRFCKRNGLPVIMGGTSLDHAAPIAAWDWVYS